VARRSDLDLTRRNFLQATGGVMLSAPLIGAAGTNIAAADAADAGLAAAQVPDIKLPPVPGKKVGFALVGLGSLAINQVMPAFAKCEKAKLTAFVSGRREKAETLAQRYGVDARHIYSYDNFDTIANDPTIDIVYIILPNSMHAEYTIRALKAGKHVLCEKPMATNVKDCEAMIAAAKAANRKLAIGYRVRHEPFNQAMIKMTRDQEFGPPKIIAAEAGFSIGDPKQWRLRKPMAGGGSLMDIGIYALNAARFLSGEEPTEVHAMMYSTPGDVRFAEVEENVLFQLRFPSGVIANCTSSYGSSVNRFRVFGTKGSYMLEPGSSYTGLRMFVYPGGGQTQERTLPQRDHFAGEMDHFAECVMNNTEPLTPGEEGLRDLRIMTAIYESATSGKTVKLA
jgi:glucose-fructose oxidoreductase